MSQKCAPEYKDSVVHEDSVVHKELVRDIKDYVVLNSIVNTLSTNPRTTSMFEVTLSSNKTNDDQIEHSFLKLTSLPKTTKYFIDTENKHVNKPYILKCGSMYTKKINDIFSHNKRGRGTTTNTTNNTTTTTSDEDSRYNSSNNSVIKTSHTAQCSVRRELNCLKSIGDTNIYIVRLLAYHEGIVNTDVAITIEKGICNLAEYMLNDNLTVIPRISHDTNLHVWILKYIVEMFNSLSEFFVSKSIVYCDWKPENIVLFDKDYNMRLKLIDFESVMANGITYDSPRIVNPIFGSPNLCNLHKECTPTFEDDKKSMCYLFCVLNNITLPWSSICINPMVERKGGKRAYDMGLCMILQQKTFSEWFHINTENAVYWPTMVEKYNWSTFMYTHV